MLWFTMCVNNSLELIGDCASQYAGWCGTLVDNSCNQYIDALLYESHVFILMCRENTQPPADTKLTDE